VSKGFVSVSDEARSNGWIIDHIYIGVHFADVDAPALSTLPVSPFFFLYPDIFSIGIPILDLGQ